MYSPQPDKYPDLIYDVGMHKGEDTEYYIKKGFRVIGFEADPELVSFCRSKFIDELNSGQLNIVEGAIVEYSNVSQEKISFYKNNKESVWGTVVNRWAERNLRRGTSNTVIEVPVVDFSANLRKYGIPYYLKIDIEGMDKVCLKVLTEFEKKPDFISLESDRTSFKNLKHELQLMRQLGYKRFKVVNQVMVSLQKEPENSGENGYLNYKFGKHASGLFGRDLPGKWRSFAYLIFTYRLIHITYLLFGYDGVLRRSDFGILIREILKKFFGIRVLGWYDTHAMHGSVEWKQK